ncbi:hypothetical protein DSO57_1029016 [Entomophthora muscae]|uniref:Uncharacterized protein n=1 Tax=Entomophthora muscae TaxID=34485 RepID=A0ACC2UL63_9FUNG|nr:hypothetical protein DSO57_1029016 [Entomophthora muscae]
MKGSYFLFLFLVPFLSVVLYLENLNPTTDWHNFSLDDSHQKKSLDNGWLKYPSGHWGIKFHYDRSTTLPPSAEPSSVRPNVSFYLLTYLGFARKLPVQNARSFPKVPILDTTGFLSEMHKSPNETCYKLPQSSESDTEPECPLNA